MKLYVVVMKVFLLSALLIVSNYNLSLRTHENREIFTQLYLEWLSDFYDKTGYVTGFIVRSEWLPDTHPSTHSLTQKSR